MKTRTWFFLPAILLLISISALFAATPKGIIKSYRKALGGKALKHVKSTYMEGTLETTDGVTGTFVCRLSEPDLIRIDMEAGDVKLSECFNGKSGWRLKSGELSTLRGERAKHLRFRAVLANTRLKDLSRFRILTERGVINTKIDGKPVIALRFKMEGIRQTLYFDSDNKYLIRQRWKTENSTGEIFYSDYRKIDGVLEPFSMRIINGSVDYKVILHKVTHNSVPTKDAFDFPRIEGDRPLPDLAMFLKTLGDNQEIIQQRQEQYTFIKTVTDQDLNKNAIVTETETRTYDVTPVFGTFVDRLIRINGTDLSESKQKKVDKKVKKEVEKILKEHQKKKAEEAKGKRKDSRKGGELTIADFLRVSKVSSMRRETFRSQKMIVFDFEPRQGYKPRNRNEDIVNKLAGVMWIDEEEKQVVRLEARLTDKFKIGMGLLASVSPSSAFIFEQDRIANEVWLPSYEEINVYAKALLFIKINKRITTTYGKYDKLKVESTYQLAKPMN